MTMEKLVLWLLLFALCVPQLAAKTVASARKEDVKFIECGVCEQIAKQLYLQVNSRLESSTSKKLTEFELIELAENICNLKRKEGSWILRLDIVEAGRRLEIVEQEHEGDCKTECKTIERACQEVMGDHDTDVAEYIFNNKAEREALEKLLCRDLSGACNKQPPPVPKDRVPGPPFNPKSSKDAEIDKLMRSLSDMPGAGGLKMYSKEDLLNMPGGGATREDVEDEEDDDDEEDDEAKTKFATASKGLGSGKKTRWQDQWNFPGIVGSAAQGIKAIRRQLEKWGTKVKSLLQSIAPGANVEL